MKELYPMFGIISTVLTPFKEGTLEIDVPSFRKYIQILLDGGVAGRPAELRAGPGGVHDRQPQHRVEQLRCGRHEVQLPRRGQRDPHRAPSGAQQPVPAA